MITPYSDLSGFVVIEFYNIDQCTILVTILQLDLSMLVSREMVRTGIDLGLEAE